jgi:hypothetical protein
MHEIGGGKIAFASRKVIFAIEWGHDEIHSCHAKHRRFAPVSCQASIQQY